MRRFTLLALAAAVGVVALALAGTAAATVAFGAAVSSASAKTQPEAAMTGTDSRASSCSRGSKPAIIAGNFKCLRVGQRCSMRYQGSYRKYSLHCANGRLRRGTGLSVTAAPSPATPPPPPAPTPAAIDGHYKGVTSQSETFEFDIVNGGYSFRGLKTGQINMGCTPHASIGGNRFDWLNYTVPVSLAGDFTIDANLNDFNDGVWAWTGRHLTIRGHMNGQVGTGSLELKYSVSGYGRTFTCGSGLQTWTVTRTG